MLQGVMLSMWTTAMMAHSPKACFLFCSKW
jgi:hypothetical protein